MTPNVTQPPQHPVGTFIITFAPIRLAGGEWAWSFWKQLDKGRALLANRYGYASRLDAKRGWREFVDGATNAQREVLSGD